MFSKALPSHNMTPRFGSHRPRRQRQQSRSADENYVSCAVMEAGSQLTNKYAEGYPWQTYYGGCGNTLILLNNLAIDA